jgi:hypothetical protein
MGVMDPMAGGIHASMDQHAVRCLGSARQNGYRDDVAEHILCRRQWGKKLDSWLITRSPDSVARDTSTLAFPPFPPQF